MSVHWRDEKKKSLKKLIEKNRIGLVTDMDGTISHIVRKPEDAVVTPHSLELLAALRKTLALVAVVSGRPAQNVRERVGLSDVEYIGNHGLERWVDGEIRHNAALKAWLPRLEASVVKLRQISIAGSQVEDKGVTVTIHYRQTDNPKQTQKQLRPLVQQIASEEGLDFFEGRMIFELRPPIKADKGIAFAELVKEFDLDGVIYLGDDTTDLAALAMARRLREDETCYALGVGVLSDDHPAALPETADLLAAGVDDVEDFLTWFFENLRRS